MTLVVDSWEILPPTGGQDTTDQLGWVVRCEGAVPFIVCTRALKQQEASVADSSLPSQHRET